MTPRLVPTLAVLGLTACATSPGSYVQAGGAADGPVLAAALVEAVVARLPPGSLVALDATPGDQADNPVTPILSAGLLHHGFALAVPVGGKLPADAHHVRYLVTPFDGGELVRVTVDGGAVEASRYFARTTLGTLQVGGPFAVRTAEVGA